ncbi:hypothetical protein Cgig2_001181 [Carnegiea gigantea]|uniref:Uncharacterized protein n=1 Tax=Carnegiea gigantea TaxID=171969 RepID=A0A9Q1QAK4_9CARY|nr:hypothetical protein Cgig2_001181 [Carnegiea gigantea]
MRMEECGDDEPNAWKWRIRERVWHLMEAQNIAQSPRPVHYRIPNFVGADLAASKIVIFKLYFVFDLLLQLSELEGLLTPQPCLRTEFFLLWTHNCFLRVASMKHVPQLELPSVEGQLGRLVCAGSVAVDPRSGAQLGKEFLNPKLFQSLKFADREYRMLRFMGVINDRTLVLTTGIMSVLHLLRKIIPPKVSIDKNPLRAQVED